MLTGYSRHKRARTQLCDGNRAKTNGSGGDKVFYATILYSKEGKPTFNVTVHVTIDFVVWFLASPLEDAPCKRMVYSQSENICSTMHVMVYCINCSPLWGCAIASNA